MHGVSSSFVGLWKRRKNQASAPDVVTLWDRSRELVRRLAAFEDRESFLDDCVDATVELLDADRGLVFLADSTGTSWVVNARSAGRTLSDAERHEASQSIVRRVLETGEAEHWEPNPEVDGTSSVIAFGIVGALAVPLPLHPNAEGPCAGVLYVDFRDAELEIGERQLAFLRMAADLITLMLERAQRLQLTREDLRAATSRSLAAPAPVLADLLASPALGPLREEVEACLQGKQPVLILGESGTGKTLLANAIAAASKGQPVVRATLGNSEDLNTIVAELFGHERGAFSGALARRSGLVEYADGGTLILDELLNLPITAQQLLLDFTQFGEYRPLGYAHAAPKRSSARIIAATNADIEDALTTGKLREDLYYRLSTTVLRLPALRERRGDIPSLAQATLNQLDPRRGWSIDVALRSWLLAPDLDWPGNIRQLESVISRARDRALAKTANCTVLTVQHVQERDVRRQSSARLECQQSSTVAISESLRRLRERQQQLEDFERQLLLAALEKHSGVVARAARELDVPRTSLISRMQTLKIQPNRED